MHNLMCSFPHMTNITRIFELLKIDTNKITNMINIPSLKCGPWTTNEPVFGQGARSM